MTDQLPDAQILVDEQWAIELLARETHTSLATVQTLFLVEFARLSAHAHILSFVPLLASSSVRSLLDARNAADPVAPAPTPD
jgi:hypothetical protein